MKSLQDILINDNHGMLLEMATCGVEKWGRNTYKIAVHGASTKDRPTPHIHIYLARDISYNEFNFEISFIDLICKDEIVPIYQMDKKKNLKKTNRNVCSWQGYKNILEGFKSYLFQPCDDSRYGNFSDNLERIIYEWNKETDFIKTNKGGNPLKEYLEKHNLTPHQKYLKYFEN